MSNKLYVGNLSFNVTEDALTACMGNYGTVTSCKVIMDRETGRSKGFAFVEMSSSSEAQEAISNLDGQDFEGRNMRVNEAKPQERNNRERRW